MNETNHKIKLTWENEKIKKRMQGFDKKQQSKRWGLQPHGVRLLSATEIKNYLNSMKFLCFLLIIIVKCKTNKKS